MRKYLALLRSISEISRLTMGFGLQTIRLKEVEQKNPVKASNRKNQVLPVVFEA
tara:strand:+ start:1442 stop:1603 length:162 start_codon:yes stop_codon:yes gene_type:complete